MNNKSKKLPFSAIIITRNEENNIKKSLNSVLWSNEIIIIDDNSNDKTHSIIRSFQRKHKNIKVFSRFQNADFAAQRNFGLSKATHSWVLFLDADEIISKELRLEIETALISNKFSGFYLNRRDYFQGQWLKYGETGNIELVRLARKDKGVWQGRVHEIWRIEGELGKLLNPLLHYPHKNISGFLTKINRYSDIVAQYWIEQGRGAGVWQIVCFPLLKFIYNYFFRLGFLDGLAGLIMAVMMSFHSFLVRSKVYLKRSP